jgi:hypothetical protein
MVTLKVLTKLLDIMNMFISNVTVLSNNSHNIPRNDN